MFAEEEAGQLRGKSNDKERNVYGKSNSAKTYKCIPGDVFIIIIIIVYVVVIIIVIIVVVINVKLFLSFPYRL